MKRVTVDFDKLVGETATYFGANGGIFRLGSAIFDVIEDESDGYRSYMERIEQVYGISEEVAEWCYKEPIFVTICDVRDGDFSGFELLTDGGQSLLRFGTDENDSYYPYYVFEVTEPKDPIGELKNIIKHENF